MPEDSLGIILRHADPFLVEVRKVGLCRHIPLFGDLAVPEGRPFRIARQEVPFKVGAGEQKLRLGVSRPRPEPEEGDALENEALEQAADELEGQGKEARALARRAWHDNGMRLRPGGGGGGVRLRRLVAGGVAGESGRPRRGRSSLSGGLAAPELGQRAVPGDAEAFLIAAAKGISCLGVPLFRGLTEQGGRLYGILRYAVALQVEETETELRGGVSLLGGFAEPIHGPSAVLGDAVAGKEAVGKDVLGLMPSLPGGLVAPGGGFGGAPGDARPRATALRITELGLGMALFGGLAVPGGGLRIVPRHAFSRAAAFRIAELSFDVALFSGLAEAFDSLRRIFRQAVPFLMADAEAVLRPGASLFDSLAIPENSLLPILWDAASLLTGEAEEFLRLRVPLFGGLAVPDGGLHIVLGHAQSLAAAVAETTLRSGMPLFGRLAEPLGRLGPILRHAVSGGVPAGQIVLRSGVPGFGRGPQGPDDEKVTQDDLQQEEWRQQDEQRQEDDDQELVQERHGESLLVGWMRERARETAGNGFGCFGRVRPCHGEGCRPFVRGRMRQTGRLSRRASDDGGPSSRGDGAPLEHLPCETLCVSHHTAWRFAEKTRFFRSLWAGRRCAVTSHFAFFKGKMLYAPVRTEGASCPSSRNMEMACSWPWSAALRSQTTA